MIAYKAVLLGLGLCLAFVLVGEFDSYDIERYADAQNIAVFVIAGFVQPGTFEPIQFLLGKPRYKHQYLGGSRHADIQ